MSETVEINRLFFVCYFILSVEMSVFSPENLLKFHTFLGTMNIRTIKGEEIYVRNIQQHYFRRWGH